MFVSFKRQVTWIFPFSLFPFILKLLSYLHRLASGLNYRNHGNACPYVLDVRACRYRCNTHAVDRINGDVVARLYAFNANNVVSREVSADVVASRSLAVEADY